jgi:hypothetical protein
MKKHGNTKPLRPRFWSKVDKRGPFPDPDKYPDIAGTRCWIWIAARNKNGYGEFRFKHRAVLAHRMGFRLTQETPLPKGICILHKCDNPACVRRSHLFEGTKTQNNEDKKEKGRSPCRKGVKNSCTHLMEADVLSIRKEYVYRCPKKGGFALGRKYRIRPSSVYNIISRRTWTHI